ncbi:MAG: cell wall-binding repeat-containing protein [Euzebya sp.]
MSRGRSVLGATVVVVTLLMTATPVAAGPGDRVPGGGRGTDQATASYAASGCFSDGSGDVTEGVSGPGIDLPPSDVVQWCISHAPADLSISVRVQQPTDPLTDATWDDYGAAIVVFYEDRRGDQRTLQLAKGTTNDTFEYYVFEGSSDVPLCRGPASFDMDLYTAVVPQSCVSSPVEVAVQVSAFYGRDQQGTFETSARDYAPDLGLITIPQGRLSGSDRITRLAGSERVGTAIAVSQASFEDGAADAIVLASSESFPDAVVAAPLAVAVAGPVLLTPAAALPEAVLSEIARAAGDGVAVYVMGGTAAVSPQVEQELVQAGHLVQRVAGMNRFETAVQAAEAANPGPRTILLAFGGDYASALVSGASAPLFDGTVVLIDSGGIPPVVQEYLDAHPQADKFPVGDRAIAAAPRLDGSVPGGTPAAVSVAIARLYPDGQDVTMASAETFPDGLSGGAYAARLRIPLLLSSRDAMDTSVLDFLRQAEPWQSITFFGGVAALSDTVAGQAAATLADQG